MKTGMDRSKQGRVHSRHDGYDHSVCELEALLLARHGIRRGTGDWPDYESAKRLIASLAPDADRYQELVAQAAEYVGV